MKSTVFTTAFALAIAAVSAVGISDVPACAVNCVNTGITATGCSISDTTCICSNKTFAAGLGTCIKTAPASCSEADQQKVMALANQFCSSGSSSSAASTGSSTHQSMATGSATHSAPTASSSSTFDISKVPTCADSCVISSLGGTSCGTSDFTCICKDQTFIQSLQPCVQKACSAADQQVILKMAETLCSQNGVNLSSVISVPATSMPATTTGANSTKTQSKNTTPTPTLYGNSTSSTTSGSSASESGSSTESTTAPSASTGAATTSARTTATAGASTGGAVKIASSGFVAAAIGAAFFLL